MPFRAGSTTLRQVGVTRPHALAALLALAALMFAGTAAADAASCATGFQCATLDVPLDRSGAFPGVVHLHYAAQRRFPKNAGVLIALAGGPGQSALDFAESFTVSLEPALHRYRIVVLDQRGTGESGALVCPAVQALRTLDSIRPEAVAACAAGVGPARNFFSTADTVQDLDALRVRLGAPKIALMGVSYGTHVALSYARAFPGQVDKLILDSVVGPNGPDAFLLDTYRAFPRILREQCRGSLCSNTTRDPVADVALTVQRLKAGPLRGTALDASGKRRPVVYSSPEELSFLLIAGDLNPFLQPYIPAALSSAVRGDTAMLMRLRKPVQGGRETVAALSAGLNVTTGCLDAPLPYSLQTPPAERPAIAATALAQIPPSEYAPFDAATIQTSSYVDDCLLWPQDSPHPPFNGPLPDVPALLLGGRLDTRTPIENSLATLPGLPHGTLVTVRGTGHDVLDSDFSACSQTALRRFIDGQPVGRPCDGVVQPDPAAAAAARVDRRLPLRARRRRPPRPRGVRHARHDRGGAPDRPSVHAGWHRRAGRRAALRQLPPRRRDAAPARLRVRVRAPADGLRAHHEQLAARPRPGARAEGHERRARPRQSRRSARAHRRQARALPRAALALRVGVLRRTLAARRRALDAAAPPRAPARAPRASLTAPFAHAKGSSGRRRIDRRHLQEGNR